MRAAMSRSFMVNSIRDSVKGRTIQISAAPIPGSTLSVQRASPADYDDVTSLRKRALGAENTNCFKFDHFVKDLSNPNTLCSMVYLNREMVGVVMSHVTDGGRTLQKMSTYFDPAVRDRSLLKQATKQVLHDVILPKWPNVTRVRGLTETNTNSLMESDGISIISKQTLLEFSLAPSIAPPPFVENVSDATFGDLNSIMTYKQAANLFPNDVILNNANVYEVSEANVGALLHYNENRYLTSEADKVRSLSLGGAANNDGPLHYVINYYGCARLDSIFGHVIRHLRQARETANDGAVMLQIGIPRQFSDIYGHQRLMAELRHVIGKKHVTDCGISDQIVFQTNA